MADETILRLSFFFGIFAIMAVAERLLPRRALTAPRGERWFANLGIVIINTLAARLILPIFPVTAALWAADQGYGLLNQVQMPGTLAAVAMGVATIVLLDLVIYGQHVASHKVPVLWRLHRMHHADTDIDVTTGARFHPIEIVLSLILKIGVVVVLGLPAVGVLAFEILLNGTAMFNHANVKLPLGLDRVLRRVLVTPDMHRVHHSDIRDETDSNYGFNLTWWDRLFGTYRDQPRLGHTSMTIGLPQFRDAGERRLTRLLTQPFRGA